MTIQDDTASPSLAADTTTTDTSPSQTGTDPASQPATTPADTQAPATPGDNTASPPDAPVDERAGLLAAVRKVVEVDPKSPGGEGAPAAPETGSSETDPKAPAQAAADALEADPTETELKGFVPKTRARVEKLLAQRNEARTKAETLEPDAASWHQMRGYLERHQLAAEDVNLLLGVGAALRRGDFKAFRDGVMPYVELANQHLGLSLPADLQAKVDAGELTDETAKELSVSRLTTARLQGEQQASTEAAKAAAQAEQDARVVQTVSQSVTNWEAEVKAKDPDYAKKAPTVLRVSQALIAEHGRPRTAEAAIELAKRAYDETNRIFAAASPAPVATRPTPSGARAVNGARPEPKSLMEAAMMGLERSRA